MPADRADRKAPPKPFNILIIAQEGRLAYEALLLTASMAMHAPALLPRLHIAEPQQNGRWPNDPRIQDPNLRAALAGYGVTFTTFECRHFGASYPYGNKIEALSSLPQGQPFLFLDTDTLITGRLDQVPFQFSRPSASMRVENTWPEPQPYVASLDQIWRSLYTRFGIDIAPTIDTSQPEDFWQRYLYFNAGWFFGDCPHQFGQRFLDYALAIRNDPGDMLAAQTLDPWLDQVALPLVIASLGGGRPPQALQGLDGDITCHYRALPLLYAKEGDLAVETLQTLAADKALRKILRQWEAARQMIYLNRGLKKVRPLFDRADLPHKEMTLRNTLKRNDLWLR